MNIWIVPASDEAATLNVPKSLSSPVPSAVLSKHGITASGDVFAWGARPGRNTTLVLDKMIKGDLCIFYTQSSGSAARGYHWAGIVEFTKQSADLSEAIWQTRDFELVYFLSQRWPLSIARQDVNKALGYNDDFAPRGLMRAALDEAGAANIRQLLDGVRHTAPPAMNEASITTPKTNLQSPPTSLSSLDLTEHISLFCRARGFRFFRSTIRTFFASLRAKPFVILAGNSGTGKSRLARLFAEAIGANAGNGRFQMIPVRPDWNDGSDLLGYFDLNGEYRPGQLIAILLRASAEPDKPYFVCLDEMNLARVEHYFSDFLSIIESRRSESGAVVTDPVLREEHIRKMKRDSLPAPLATIVEGLQRNARPIGLPPNLYIVGTVNMDETTQPFSRKVLDRANTLEFNEIDLEEGLADDGPGSPVAPLELSSAFLSCEFTSLKDILTEHRAVAAKIASFLQSLNASLILAGFEVGYRVRDEAIAFTIYALGAGMSQEEAEENIVLQKVLPRVQGSSSRIETALISLMNRLRGDEDVPEKDAPDYSARLEQLRARDDASPVLRKLAGMLLIFREEGFTSFWLA